MSDGSGAPAKHLKRKLAAGDAVVGIIGLTWKAREFNQHTKFIELAGQIKSAMPDYVVQVLGSAMDRAHAKAFNGARVLISGVAYKKNIADIRESPALTLIELIEKHGARVDCYDPPVGKIGPTRDHSELTNKQSIAWDLNAIAAYDPVLIDTDHDAIDSKALAKAARLIVDTRNACARAGADLTKVVRA